jgi:hypothetical protein
MKADRSRNTFDPAKHYRRVLHQQGRVVLDSDDNEQVSIDLASSETTLSDVIGPSGVPETSLSAGYAGGFAIAISNPGGSSSSASSSSSSSKAGSSSSSSKVGSSSSSSNSSSGPLNQLTIAHGRIYVDGILVINDADTTLFTQPFLPLNSQDGSAPTGLAGPGVYAVYLDVWERVITPVDDPSIQEIALGGPDTCLRTQIAWQVRLGQIDTKSFGQNPLCSQIPPPWPQNPNQGLVTASPGAPSADPLPCALPPQTGYRSLENQLYRVEVHSPGGYGAASFKWSRENGSVVFGIVPAPGQAPTGTVSGKLLYVTSTGRDASLGVKHGDWVELIDDHSELVKGRGELLQVDFSDSGQMTITLLSAPSQPIDLTRHPKLRRWDQTQNVGKDGTIVIQDGAPISLENGVQVQFSNGQYSVGDYWLIPARTATAQQQVGTIEWPRDTVGNYLPRPPQGVVHHYCKLGIVAFDGVSFQPPPGASSVTDCRTFFPPLTNIPSQVGCTCTITLQPGSNWTAQLAHLFPGNVPVDAEICFAVGEFDTTQPVLIRTTGHVKVSGAGWGTQLIGKGVETVLRFQGCASVSVRDLAATAGAGNPVDVGHIGGALEFDDCDAVTVEDVSLTCGDTTTLTGGAACLTVRNSVTETNAASGAGTVYVRGSRFTVGQMQYGMLLVHVENAFLEGNDLRSMPGPARSFAVSLEDPIYRALATRALVAGAGVVSLPKSSSSSSSSSSSHSSSPSSHPSVSAAPPSIKLNAAVSVGAVSIKFSTPPQLTPVWQTYVNNNGPKSFATNADLLRFVQGAAKTLLANPDTQKQFAGFGAFVHSIDNRLVLVAKAAIVVGGQGVADLRVTNNFIDGFLQGVVVGVSHREGKPNLPADSAGSVTIRDNRINVTIDEVIARAAARYAIFVGNVASLQVENNYATAAAIAESNIDTDGIRVFGYLGGKMIIRHNHVANFKTGVRVTQVAAPGGNKHRDTVVAPPTFDYVGSIRTGPLFLIADNVIESSRTPIHAPSCLQISNVV